MGLYDLKTKHLDGSAADLGDFRDKVTLVVNVASECGFTPQYAGLQKLHDELSGRGFAVLGFPSNEFGGQEPGSPDQIKTFCERNYGVTFPLFAKGETKPGAGQSPVYAFLTRSGDVPTWNFCKYLVGKNGDVRAFLPEQRRSGRLLAPPGRRRGPRRAGLTVVRASRRPARIDRWSRAALPRSVANHSSPGCRQDCAGSRPSARA